MRTGFFKDPKTGKNLAPDAFIKREATEWIEAIGAVISETAGHSKKAGNSFIVTTEADIKKMLALHQSKTRKH